MNDEIGRLDAQIAVALRSGEEALARTGAARQIELEDSLVLLHQRLQETVERTGAAEAELLALRAKREEMELALSDLLAARASASLHPAAPSAPSARAQQLGLGFSRAMAGASGSCRGRRLPRPTRHRSGSSTPCSRSSASASASNGCGQGRAAPPPRPCATACAAARGSGLPEPSCAALS